MGQRFTHSIASCNEPSLHSQKPRRIDADVCLSRMRESCKSGQAVRAWHGAIWRRGQKRRMSWDRFNALLRANPLPPPRLVHVWRGRPPTYLGTDVTPQKFVEAIREHQPHILCLSALLTVTARPRYALFGTDGVVHAAIHINQLSLGCHGRGGGRARNFARLRFRLVSLCARYRAPTELALSRRRHRLTPPARAWPQRRPSAPARRSARPVGRRRTSRRR